MRFLYILLFSASLFAGEWTINDFTIRGKQFTQSATGILQGNLNRIPSYRAPKGDELLLRRRLDMNNYGLYVGKAEASAYTNLSRFTKPAGMSMDKLLKMKFFKSEVPTGYNDVADIYFQGEYLYVENLVRIFYKENGSWKSLEVAQGEKPGVLEIASTPSGATVTIDGVVKGKTPYSFVMDAPTVEVEVSMSGYYSQSFTADAKPGAVKKFVPELHKKITIGSTTDPATMLDTSLTDIGDVETRIDAIKKARDAANAQEMAQLKKFEATYPKLSPRGEFEERADFAERERAYISKKAAERAKIAIDEAAYSRAGRVMGEHLSKLDAVEYSLYLPLNSVKLSRYDIDRHQFLCTLTVKQGAFDFTFVGTLPMETVTAKKFKFSSSEKGLKVTYGKRQVTVSVNGKKQKKYFKYGKLVLPFEGEEYELRGKTTLPTVVTNSRDVKAYYAELDRLERMRRLAWLTRGMKKIPNGIFQMGSNNGESDEKPVHRVKVSGFWMDSTEVTRVEYKRLMGVNPSLYKVSNLPVDRVTWWDAIKYCNARSREAGLIPCYNESSGKCNFSANGYRLPTEAEWEYACRAGSRTNYYWNNKYGFFGKNSFGLSNMSTKVWEWCNDWYGSYSNDAAVDPRGVNTGSYRIIRGGIGQEVVRLTHVLRIATVKALAVGIPISVSDASYL